MSAMDRVVLMLQKIGTGFVRQQISVTHAEKPYDNEPSGFNLVCLAAGEHPTEGKIAR